MPRFEALRELQFKEDTDIFGKLEKLFIAQTVGTAQNLLIMMAHTPFNIDKSCANVYFVEDLTQEEMIPAAGKFRIILKHN